MNLIKGLQEMFERYFEESLAIMSLSHFEYFDSMKCRDTIYYQHFYQDVMVLDL